MPAAGDDTTLDAKPHAEHLLLFRILKAFFLLFAFGWATCAVGDWRVDGVEPWSAESPMLYRLRLELLTPDEDLVSAEIYNKLFTMHGVTMIFFFLVPHLFSADWLVPTLC